MEDKPAIRTMLLPQYQNSEEFMERFLVAIHEEGRPIARSANSQGIKLVDESELSSDVFTYFSDNAEKLSADFFRELSGRIGRRDAKLFCDVLVEDWYDGRRRRESGRTLRLKRSVYDYISACMGRSCDEVVQRLCEFDDVKPLLSAKSIASILTLNDFFIEEYIHDWLSRHPNYSFFGSEGIFLRRGLSLQSPLNTSELYRERDFISSYSIAISAPEKFSQMLEGNVPAIVNGELCLFENRVLFFSPLIQGMALGQLEFGVIPSEKPLPIHFQGKHGDLGILEYILDPAPFEVEETDLA